MRKAEEFVYRAVLDGLLEIDAQGRIWKIARRQSSRWGQAVKIIPCKRKRAEHKGRYLVIKVMYDGVRGAVGAHRLVWYHFKGPIPDRLTINHKDGDEHNNRLTNLELANYKEQAIHAMRVLGWKPFNGCRFTTGILGESNGQAKLTEAAIKKIRKAKKTGVELARRYNVSEASVSRVKNFQTWGHV